MQKALRLKRELEVITNRPPPGISCSPKDERFDHLEASIIGLQGTPYESGVFKLDVHIPDKYPFDPPHLKFKTPIYHPNVDVSGRICLDLLRLPPKGAWRPVISLAGLLTSIQVLLATPNPDDPLMAEIAEEYSSNKPEFERKAREWTKKYASPNSQTDKKSEKRKSEDSAEQNIAKKQKNLM